jgi:hypothetical protein
MIKYFLAGMFLFNGMPHLVKGITGEKHMTPFKRVSSPKLNVVWAFVNFVFGILILGFDPITGTPDWPTDANVWVFLGGGLVLGLVCAKLFGDPNAKLPWHKD